MGVLRQSDQNCNATRNKVPDYAKDYKNEYLFIRGIDNYFKYFIKNLNKADKGVLKSNRVDIINKHINRLEKAQRLDYLKDTSDIEIDEQDVSYSSLLLEMLADFTDYYVDDDDFEFDEDRFNSHVDLEFPGYKDLLNCIALFHSKFKMVFDKYKINWHDSDSDDDDGIDSDDIETMFDSDDEYDSDSSFNDI